VKRVSTNKDATRVKLEDLRDNSDITRLKGVRQKDFERVQKYNRAYLFLRTTLETTAASVQRAHVKKILRPSACRW
jgi:hypothetical protein